MLQWVVDAIVGAEWRSGTNMLVGYSLGSRQQLDTVTGLFSLHKQLLNTLTTGSIHRSILGNHGNRTEMAEEGSTLILLTISSTQCAHRSLGYEGGAQLFKTAPQEGLWSRIRNVSA